MLHYMSMEMNCLWDMTFPFVIDNPINFVLFINITFVTCTKKSNVFICWKDFWELLRCNNVQLDVWNYNYTIIIVHTCVVRMKATAWRNWFLLDDFWLYIPGKVSKNHKTALKYPHNSSSCLYIMLTLINRKIITTR